MKEMALPGCCIERALLMQEEEDDEEEVEEDRAQPCSTLKWHMHKQ